MKQSLFMLVAAIAGMIFGLMMFLSPGSMLDQVGVAQSPILNMLMQMIAMNVVIFGIMLLMSRNDASSPAVRALLVGNFLLHIGNLALDWYGASMGLYKATGLIGGSLLHVVLGFGFLYFLVKSPSQASA